MNTKGSRYKVNNKILTRETIALSRPTHLAPQKFNFYLQCMHLFGFLIRLLLDLGSHDISIDHGLCCIVVGCGKMALDGMEVVAMLLNVRLLRVDVGAVCCDGFLQFPSLCMRPNLTTGALCCF